MSDFGKVAVFNCEKPGYAVYFLSDDSFSVCMDYELYDSVSLVVDRKARRITAKSHVWEYDFYLNTDWSKITSGTCKDPRKGIVWNYGTEAGQLDYSAAKDVKPLHYAVICNQEILVWQLLKKIGMFNKHVMNMQNKV